MLTRNCHTRPTTTQRCKRSSMERKKGSRVLNTHEPGANWPPRKETVSHGPNLTGRAGARQSST